VSIYIVYDSQHQVQDQVQSEEHEENEVECCPVIHFIEREENIREVRGCEQNEHVKYGIAQIQEVVSAFFSINKYSFCLLSFLINNLEFFDLME
jgi:hypothetical protein